MKEKRKKIGLLTGGGDCPGLNAVIRACVRHGINIYDDLLIGFRDGWKGVLENDVMLLDLNATSGILYRGGTILGTSRTNPYKRDGGPERVKDVFKLRELDGLIAIGGEDTLGTAKKLYEDYELPIIGIPKTIDNDIPGTDYTFGFDTAVNIATEAIDRLHSTAESHKRVIVVEVMGRSTGWIAWASGLAGGANVILIPEFPLSIDEVCENIEKRYLKNKTYAIVVVSEGYKIDEQVEVVSNEKDEFGHPRLGGIGSKIAEILRKKLNVDVRTVVLGYLLRGGSPTAFDRLLGTRFGVAAIDLLHQNKFGRAVALKGVNIIDISFEELLSGNQGLTPDKFNLISTFIG